MAAQAALIAETIASMNQALARYQDGKSFLRRHHDIRETHPLLTAASDSDEQYMQPSNRGNKLKRKVHNIEDRHSGRSRGLKRHKRVSYPILPITVMNTLTQTY